MAVNLVPFGWPSKCVRLDRPNMNVTGAITFGSGNYCVDALWGAIFSLFGMAENLEVVGLRREFARWASALPHKKASAQAGVVPSC